MYVPAGDVIPGGSTYSAGLLNASGTPAFLRDLSLDSYQSSWTDVQQGGLDVAQFDCRISYEDDLDLLFGNWIIFGCMGAALNANANPGDGTLTVSGLNNVQAPGQHDLANGDLVILSDGTNAELFIVSGVNGAGGGTWTVSLKAAWGNIMIETQCQLAKQAAQGAGTVIIDTKTSPSGHVLANGDKIVIGSDQYTATTITGNGDGTFTVNLGSPNNTVNSYAQGTPVSIAAAGATSIRCTTVQGLPNGTVVYFDSGSNVDEHATVTGKPGGPVFTIGGGGLSNPHGAGAPIIFQMSSTVLNTYHAGQAVVARVQYQGYITSRIHSTQGNGAAATSAEQLSISATGFFSRYNFLVDSSSVNNGDCAGQMTLDLASYGSTLPGIIVNRSDGGGGWLWKKNGITCNISETDSTFMQVMDDILRQENGNALNVQYAVWVAQDRQVRHLPIATIPGHQKAGQGYTSTPTYHLNMSDLGGDFGDTIATCQTTDEDGTGLLNAAIVTGATAPQGGGASDYNSTTIAQTYTSGTTLIVAYIPPAWLQSGSGLYIWVNRGQSTAEIQQFVSYSGVNVHVGMAYAEVLNVGDTVEMVTELTGNFKPGPGATNAFACGNSGIFQVGQQITITPTGPTSETFTIQAIPNSTHIQTTKLPAQNHNPGNIVCLAKSGSGTGPRILVEQTDSIAAYGFFEGTLNNTDIYDETKLAKWAARQLSVLGWPKFASQVQLNNTSARISGRDLIQITGFANGANSVVQNVQKVQYNATAADMNISATIDLGVMASTASRVIKERSKESAQRIKYHIPTHKGNEWMHSHGHDLQQTDTNQITIASGTVKAAGAVYQVAGLTTTVPDGESRWGALSGPGVSSPAIVEMPYRLWSGRKVYADAVYLIDQQGDDPTLDQIFTGIPLWKVQSRGGAIVGYEPLFETRGVTLSNLPSVVAPDTPQFTAFSATVTIEANNVAGDLSFSGAFTNFPTDGSCAEIKIYSQSTSYMGGVSHKATIKVPDAPQPSPNQSIATEIHGLPLGETINIWASYDGFNGEGPAAEIIAGFVMPPAPPATSYITSSSTLPSGVGGGASPTPTAGPGMLCIYTASGTGVNSKLYVYDEVVGWKPYSVTA